jgi:hypothetical protein
VKERDQWGDHDVGGRIILGWIFRKWNLGVMDWIGLAQGRQVASNCECGNKTSGSIKRGKFLD